MSMLTSQRQMGQRSVHGDEPWRGSIKRISRDQPKLKDIPKRKQRHATNPLGATPRDLEGAT